MINVAFAGDVVGGHAVVRYGVSAVARTTNVHERFDRQYRINRDLPDPV